jgi:hypothetical protein
VRPRATRVPGVALLVPVVRRARDVHGNYTRLQAWEIAFFGGLSRSADRERVALRAMQVFESVLRDTAEHLRTHVSGDAALPGEWQSVIEAVRRALDPAAAGKDWRDAAREITADRLAVLQALESVLPAYESVLVDEVRQQVQDELTAVGLDIAQLDLPAEVGFYLLRGIRRLTESVELAGVVGCSWMAGDAAEMFFTTSAIGSEGVDEAVPALVRLRDIASRVFRIAKDAVVVDRLIRLGREAIEDFGRGPPGSLLP